jgi:hypothetical protein
MTKLALVRRQGKPRLELSPGGEVNSPRDNLAAISPRFLLRWSAGRL